MRKKDLNSCLETKMGEIFALKKLISKKNLPFFEMLQNPQFLPIYAAAHVQLIFLSDLDNLMFI